MIRFPTVSPKEIPQIRRIVLLAVLIVLFFASAARADTLGQDSIFFVDTEYDAFGRSSVSATLRRISDRVYGYVEDDYWAGISASARDQITNQIESILNEFSIRIYPLETQFFGSEPNPGIDNDPKITVLFTPLIENAGGYFGNTNVYPKNTDNKTSNEREMFYINVSAISDLRKANSFLAHEFQHLISFNQKEKLRDVSDDVWLNETRSEHAVTLLGYNDRFSDSSLERRLRSFIGDPSDSLTEWKNLTPDYSAVAMFGEYLTEHWPTAVLADSLREKTIGIASLESALARNGFSQSFLDIFRYWLIAGIVNDTAVDPKFGYTRDGLKNFRVSPSRSFANLGDNSAFVVSDSFKDWQPNWYQISGFAASQNKFLRIKFSSPSLTSFLISYLVFKSGGSVQALTFEPDFHSDTLFIDDGAGDVAKVIIMPIKKDKIGGFSAKEDSVNLSLAIDRINQPPPGYAIPTPSVPPPAAPLAVKTTKPSDFALKEGDFIRAEGDNNVYIVNDFGYKRLVLSPQICQQYRHLGARGCFEAVKTVAPQVRDAFKTSWYFTNGETQDGLVYWLETTGEDSALLHHVNVSGSDFVGQGGDFQSVFLFNALEQKSYDLGGSIVKISPL